MRILRLFALLLGLGLTVSTNAQFPGGNQSTLNAAMLKLFSDFSNFVSKADLELREKGTAPTTMTVDLAMLAGKVRMDLDMANLKSSQFPAQALATFKAAGLDKLATIARPDRRMSMVIYPAAKSYVEIPMSKEEAADINRKFTVAKTKLGQESVGGRSCEKNKVILTSDTGEKHEALVWYAADPKNFPVKVEMEQGSSTVVMLHRDVKLTKPEAKQFEAPTGFTKHASMEALMQGAMMKLMGGGKQ